jgi:hypothetical protein
LVRLPASGPPASGRAHMVRLHLQGCNYRYPLAAGGSAALLPSLSLLRTLLIPSDQIPSKSLDLARNGQKEYETVNIRDRPLHADELGLMHRSNYIF